MSAGLDLYFKKEILETMLKVVNAKQLKGVAVTAFIDDEVKAFQNGEYTSLQNVSAFVSQSQEDKDSGKPKFYVANGKVFWVSETGVRTAKDIHEGSADTLPAADTPPSVDNSGLPF